MLYVPTYVYLVSVYSNCGRLKKNSLYVVICRSQSFYEHVGMYVCMYVHAFTYYTMRIFFDQFIKKWILLFPYVRTNGRNSTIQRTCYGTVLRFDVHNSTGLIIATGKIEYRIEFALTLWFQGLVIVAEITNIDRNCCRFGNNYGFISSFY